LALGLGQERHEEVPLGLGVVERGLLQRRAEDLAEARIERGREAEALAEAELFRRGEKAVELFGEVRELAPISTGHLGIAMEA
jgi:hypothetical protein